MRTSGKNSIGKMLDWSVFAAINLSKQVAQLKVESRRTSSGDGSTRRFSSSAKTNVSQVGR
jgi:hypothetical protein